MSNTTRPYGFYWIMHQEGGPWEMGLWTGEAWRFIAEETEGDVILYNDYELHNIHEEQILPPNDQQ